MTAPVPARDHANMTVAQREFTFDALLAEFGDPEASATPVAAPAPAAAPLVAPSASTPQSRRVPDAAAVASAPTKRSLAKASAARASAPSSAAPSAAAAPKPRRARRSLALPPDEILKLGGLVVVAGISLTLAFVALSR
ncbi:hypothetical protein ITJ38_01225 [Agreia pratensis]|uniref:hypothetical protein n=1 Tax=Agreia pratensis TaxID=150121 RepID=UPI00188A72B2|nr:hypothetical protein [Agreia pratensis]MBF4633019.1 hypothetical protein [Agreia pratensis]